MLFIHVNLSRKLGFDVILLVYCEFVLCIVCLFLCNLYEVPLM